MVTGVLDTILLNVTREKGITTLKIYQYLMINHEVTETFFERLKSTEH